MTGIAGIFECDHVGCTAPAFGTQDCLDRHMSSHSTIRPYYCPVPGCARYHGGRGFKRKNEMIRHGLVHASPRYVCPFCPERNVKYPRPDSLQKHVRVNHRDKDVNDPRLRAELAHGCEEESEEEGEEENEAEGEEGSEEENKGGREWLESKEDFDPH
ncbi:hypothetical protein BDR22DRAFT_803722 [Usnea florida]